MYNQESTEFEAKIGLKQGCVLSPLLFSIVTDDTIKECKEKCESLTLGRWKMKNVIPKEVLLADDMVLVAEIEENLELYQKELRKINVKVSSMEKSKTMIISMKE
jgi:hypothetical protein